MSIQVTDLQDGVIIFRGFEEDFLYQQDNDVELEVFLNQWEQGNKELDIIQMQDASYLIEKEEEEEEENY